MNQRTVLPCASLCVIACPALRVYFYVVPSGNVGISPRVLYRFGVYLSLGQGETTGGEDSYKRNMSNNMCQVDNKVLQ